MRISDWSSDVCSSDLRRDLACHFALIWLDDLKHQLFRCVERLTDFVIEPQSSGLQHMDRAEQINGRILILHHPERGIGAGEIYGVIRRSEEHTSELQSLMRISYAVFCLKKKNKQYTTTYT